MLEALTNAVNDKRKEEAEAWTTERELLATTVELLHSLIVITLRAHGAKEHIKPFRVPRPYDEQEPADDAVSFGAFAKQLRRG
jgi:hypothetical protein